MSQRYSAVHLTYNYAQNTHSISSMKVFYTNVLKSIIGSWKVDEKRKNSIHLTMLFPLLHTYSQFDRDIFGKTIDMYRYIAFKGTIIQFPIRSWSSRLLRGAIELYYGDHLSKRRPVAKGQTQWLIWMVQAHIPWRVGWLICQWFWRPMYVCVKQEVFYARTGLDTKCGARTGWIGMYSYFNVSANR